jgi:hypothetical protein
MQERNFILTDVMKSGFHQDVEQFISEHSLAEQNVDVEGNYYNLHLYNLPSYTRRIALIDCRAVNKSLSQNKDFIYDFNRRTEKLRLQGFVFVQSSSWESVQNNSQEYYPKLDAIDHIKWFSGNSWWWWYMFRKYEKHTFLFDHYHKTFDFLCLLKNRKSHRDALYNKLCKENILSNSLYTFHGLNKSLKLPAEYELPFLPDRNNYPQHGLDQDMYERPYNESVCNIVSETTVGSDNFITEKTWKPIIAKQPFVIHGPDGILRQLREMGFQTFNNIWDESYDEQTNPDKKIAMIVEICKFIKCSDWKSLYEKTKSVREHNHQHFFNKGALSKTINKVLLSWFKFFDSSKISSGESQPIH